MASLQPLVSRLACIDVFELLDRILASEDLVPGTP